LHDVSSLLSVVLFCGWPKGHSAVTLERIRVARFCVNFLTQKGYKKSEPRFEGTRFIHFQSGFTAYNLKEANALWKKQVR